jgi:hypothetical protein
MLSFASSVAPSDPVSVLSLRLMNTEPLSAVIFPALAKRVVTQRNVIIKSDIIFMPFS